MTWQSSAIDPATTTPAGDISKIKNDLAVLRAVLGGTLDGDVPAFSLQTFTPLVKGLSSAGVGTYTYQAGAYVQMGSLVLFTLNVSYSAHTGTGPLVVTLPKQHTGACALAATCRYTGNGVTITGQPVGEIAGGNSFASIYVQNNGALSNPSVQAPASLMLSGFLFTS